MITYLDASALVKRHVTERGSAETVALLEAAEMVATSVVSRAEVAAALAKAPRVRVLSPALARSAQRSFAGDWPDLVRVPVNEGLVEQAGALAWEHGLRGYDAVQLASALAWQQSVGTEILPATFDQLLWKAADNAGLRPWPESPPT